MKIEKQEQKFNPITITLESQGEADLLIALLGKVAGGHEDSMFYQIYRALGGKGTYDQGIYKVVSGSIRVAVKDGPDDDE